jgi:hypothetical protein
MVGLVSPTKSGSTFSDPVDIISPPEKSLGFKRGFCIKNLDLGRFICVFLCRKNLKNAHGGMLHYAFLELYF